VPERGPPRCPTYSWRFALTTLRDEDITTTTNTLPAGDADQGDSNEQQADPAGVDTTSADPAGGDADQSDKGDADQSDKGDADSSDN
jgi:hypothetical protein